MKNTVITFRQAKGREKLTMLTAYDYSTARLMDQEGINALLVGDSLGMVMLGHPDTLSVTLEDMIHHCAAVARGASSALVVCDMPFMSYQVSVPETLRNAGRLIREGRAQAVKLEGGAHFCPQVRALVRASIPVMGHLGLTPQSVHALGGYKVQGKSAAAAQKLLDDARALEDAGAFSLVLECVPAALAARISREISIPTIGIGAGPDCDGQVLVWQDMLGLCDTLAPKFVKRFGAVGQAMRAAFAAYAREVKSGTFPAQEHCYSLEDEAAVLEKLY
ncbi:3-methyl-2-oxobutanoate hydroxymethyltransferase [Desulfovibrio sp. ZJ369]|uniref:3-methyl-2-oxobutanoate hydroxymethyltransferase n=1 Tax=Desulfovibrio sp. ZJ369 TaxID=2709793 RepID=UPI0013ED8166|nr:3-methyl-2-oxobutanoate hydroxymethyltransferase [Desulfovibrio sp. ZJ369]